MDDAICRLDDATATRVLAAVTRARLRDGGPGAEWTPELARALREAFDVPPDAGGTASEGDLARQALLVLDEDPRDHEALAALIEGPAAQSFGVVTTAVVVSGVLFALQTHVEFEYKDGKVHVKVKKTPTSDSLLKPLVEKLLGFFSARPPGTP